VSVPIEALKLDVFEVSISTTVRLDTH